MSRSYRCGVCGSEGDFATFIVKEMMFGFRDEFTYVECASCGCLQIADIPADMKKYYPAGYCSFLPRSDVLADKRDNSLTRYLRHKRSEYALDGRNFIGRLANIIKPVEYSSAENLSWLKRCRAGLESRILDVGCGSGNLLLNLERLGFKRLVGLDPYIERDIDHGGRVKIRKGTMRDIAAKFDVIMLQHSLEHMTDPAAAFRDMARLLERGAHAVIRTPIVPSYAWEHYRAAWVQLDAPRHLFVFSLKGIGLLARGAGLEIENTIFDSTEFQFLGSEQYVKGIPLTDSNSYFIHHDNRMFTKADIERFKAKAAELNEQNMGDQVALYLTKP